MKTLHFLLGDQLSRDLSSLRNIDKSNSIIMLCEVMEEFTYVKHHKKKIAFIISSMRHFAKELHDEGYNIRYIKLDDTNNTGSLFGEVNRACQDLDIKAIIVTHPSEYRTLSNIKTWQKKLNISVKIKDDDRFLCPKKEFAEWVKGRNQIRMETFYREMRSKYSILMDDEKPEGGKWNYDSENRKTPKQKLNVPQTYKNNIDGITQEVLDLVAIQFSDHFGDLMPFHYAVTRAHALKALDLFVKQRLINFGDYQDAMIEGEPWMYHSHISFYINCGLLSPIECIKIAEKAYYDKKSPINAVEGFIRQIIGWREYINGIYWLKMPGYSDHNFFNATRNLPDFYWSAKTQMNCLHQCVKETKENAYAHHIQRLMVLGNFALIAGINPKHVNEWFLIVYADAYEWVELPNVSGMSLFADGGYLASKPYASGGSYINKMSNYCKNCTYKINEKTGSKACPFNYLYWDFLDRNRDKLIKNQRIGMMYNTYDRMDNEKKEAIRKDSARFLSSLD